MRRKKMPEEPSIQGSNSITMSRTSVQSMDNKREEWGVAGSVPAYWVEVISGEDQQRRYRCPSGAWYSLPMAVHRRRGQP